MIQAEGKHLEDVLELLAPGELDSANVVRAPIDFYCRCNMKGALKSLQELNEHDRQRFGREFNHIIKCQFCQKPYDVKALEKLEEEQRTNG